MPNRLPINLGTPYHGLAVDHDCTFAAGTSNEHTVEIYPTSGGSLLVRHPAAPGANRTPEQLAIDNALGHEWRDYALLTGFDRVFNGGKRLGPNAWLYCAPNGTTWWLDVDYEWLGTGSSAYIRVSVVRKSLFGWFNEAGGPIGPDQATVATLDFVPALPAGYAGPYTTANYRLSFPADGISVVPNEDGSDVLVNMYKKGDGNNSIIDSLYPATKTGAQSGSLGTFAARYSLNAVLRITCSGSPDPETGAGLIVSIAVDSEYDDLVIKDDPIPSQSPSLPPIEFACSPDFDLDTPPTQQQVDDGVQVLVTWTCSWVSGAGAVTTRQTGLDRRGVSFKHHDGAVENITYTDTWQQHTAATSGQAVWQERYQAKGNENLGTLRWDGLETYPRTSDLEYVTTTQEFVRQRVGYSVFGHMVEADLYSEGPLITREYTVDPDGGALALQNSTSQGGAVTLNGSVSYPVGTNLNDIGLQFFTTTLDCSAAFVYMRYKEPDLATDHYKYRTYVFGNGQSFEAFSLDGLPPPQAGEALPTKLGFQPVTGEYQVSYFNSAYPYYAYF